MGRSELLQQWTCEGPGRWQVPMQVATTQSESWGEGPGTGVTRGPPLLSYQSFLKNTLHIDSSHIIIPGDR